MDGRRALINIKSALPAIPFNTPNRNGVSPLIPLRKTVGVFQGKPPLRILILIPTAEKKVIRTIAT